MHELSIALSITDMAEEEAERHGGGARVAAVHLRLGPLSGVVKEALLSAYELAREGSAVEHSRLVIEEVPIRIFCATCDVESRCILAGDVLLRVWVGPVSGRQRP